MDEDEALNVTLGEAVRAPAKSEFEQLIASKLALAIMASDRLQTIAHVLEACSLLPPETVQQLFTCEERENFDRLYKVCISLLNTVELPASIPYVTGRYAVVAWCFTCEDAPYYLSWLSRVWRFPDVEQLIERLMSGDNEAWHDYLRALFYFTSSENCPLSLIKQIQSEFIIYCKPIVDDIMRKIFSKVISRETWQQTLTLMRGSRKP